MATKHIISPGIGFTPGSVKYIVTRGLIAGPPLIYYLDPDSGAFRLFTDHRDYVGFSDHRAYVIIKERRGND